MTPSNVEVKPSSSLSLLVSWGEIPPEGRNGIILGYYIFLKNSTSQTEQQFIVHGNNTFSYKLTNLHYGEYYVSVAGYTRISFGPRSLPVKSTPLGGGMSVYRLVLPLLSFKSDERMRRIYILFFYDVM